MKYLLLISLIITSYTYGMNSEAQQQQDQKIQTKPSKQSNKKLLRCLASCWHSISSPKNVKHHHSSSNSQDKDPINQPEGQIVSK